MSIIILASCAWLAMLAANTAAIGWANRHWSMVGVGAIGLVLSTALALGWFYGFEC